MIHPWLERWIQSVSRDSSLTPPRAVSFFFGMSLWLHVAVVLFAVATVHAQFDSPFKDRPHGHSENRVHVDRIHQDELRQFAGDTNRLVLPGLIADRRKQRVEVRVTVPARRARATRSRCRDKPAHPPARSPCRSRRRGTSRSRRSTSGRRPRRSCPSDGRAVPDPSTGGIREASRNPEGWIRPRPFATPGNTLPFLAAPPTAPHRHPHVLETSCGTTPPFLPGSTWRRPNLPGQAQLGAVPQILEQATSIGHARAGSPRAAVHIPQGPR